jgi:5S rRNA maturation endonuclease (ribonuclease M5)
VSARNGKRQAKERTTVDLLPNQWLTSAQPPRSYTTLASPWGVAHGVTFGDGYRTANYGSRVALWGDKDAALLKYFPLSPTSQVESEGGVPGIVVEGLPRFFKDLPSLDEAPAYLYGWLAGYFAADGCVTDAGLPLLACARRDVLQFVRDLCDRLGVVTHGIRSQRRVGLGKEETEIFTLPFSRASLTEEFFLIEEHRSRWLEHRDVAARLGWVVESVTETDEVEEVFCAEVPDTHDFVLEDHILTGNCFSCGYQGAFVVLVKDMLEIPYSDAIAWVRKRGGIERVKKFLAKKAADPKTVDTTKQINEASLALYVTPPLEACSKRLFMPEDAEACGVLWDTERDMWIVPVRDPDTGVLWGWQEKNERYFRNRPTSMTKSKTLFGLHTYEDDTAILVESPLDVVRLRACGFKAGLSSFGAGVSDVQMSLIRDHFETVIIALDNDTDGAKHSERLRTEWSRRGLALKFLDYSGAAGAKDVGEMGADQIKNAVRNAYSSVVARF